MCTRCDGGSPWIRFFPRVGKRAASVSVCVGMYERDADAAIASTGHYFMPLPNVSYCNGNAVFARKVNL